ncbi:winged helix-turn-helix domain-containing protein [Candidatus Azobacteroides pseudotrichonymphae]|uniref:winged helix-turn-helix domain-containing protein n=1 Tax=Candidatus Azobacteroides pseudotrichonymphae TaxID=511435 RepID=UPI00223C7D77|nr:winged helix-turn-helix domain-containing protein [Candidatus Azobacteroides pseudotrichonymphae]
MRRLSNMGNSEKFRMAKVSSIQRRATQKVLSVNAEVEIGSNAGRVWSLLNEEGTKSVKEIIKRTKFSELEIYLSVGWLAREGKLNFEEQNNEMYLSLK